MNAGPWLAVPPRGYGGIENVVATLVRELRRAGHRVILAAVGESTAEADGRVCAFDTAQFPHLGAAYGLVTGIVHAHMNAVVREVRRNPEIDIVHDHVEVVGASMLAALGAIGPPALQTLHWDLRKHPDFYEQFDGGGRVWFAAVSDSQLATAPANLAAQTVGVVPLAAPPGPVDPAPPGDHLLALGRLTRVKGFHIAARTCRRLGRRLLIAGPVGGFDDRQALDAALADPASPVRGYTDVSYFLDELVPLLDGEVVRWVGSVAGPEKDRLVRTARAMVFPLLWEEPGGTAIVESLLAGVPVVGYRRGCLPSLVEHGVTGFVADDEDELAEYLGRVDELDREVIARCGRDRFSPARMGAAYVSLYEQVIERAASAGLDARGSAATAN